MKERQILSRALPGLLALGMAAGTPLALAVEPRRASPTITSYSCYMLEGDSTGVVGVNYDVKATDIADLLGVSTLQIYRSDGTFVVGIVGSTKNGLMEADSTRHMGTYVYPGTSGASYYAIVTVSSTIGSESDSRTVTTNMVTAP